LQNSGITALIIFLNTSLSKFFSGFGLNIPKKSFLATYSATYLIPDES